MKKVIKANVEGVELVLCASDPHSGDVELWHSWGGWDGPNDPAPISAWSQRIKDWRIAKQIDAGFEVWNLLDQRPKYWHKRPAVFREDNPKRVLTRNGNFDPCNLYGIELVSCAMDTLEVAEAIENARKLHAEAVEARDRFKAAVRAIPRMTVDDWRNLPAKTDIQ